MVSEPLTPKSLKEIFTIYKNTLGTSTASYTTIPPYPMGPSTISASFTPATWPPSPTIHRPSYISVDITKEDAEKLIAMGFSFEPLPNTMLYKLHFPKEKEEEVPRDNDDWDENEYYLSDAYEEDYESFSNRE